MVGRGVKGMGYKIILDPPLKTIAIAAKIMTESKSLSILRNF